MIERAGDNKECGMNTYNDSLVSFCYKEHYHVFNESIHKSQSAVNTYDLVPVRLIRNPVTFNVKTKCRVIVDMV